jgi:hypothetical protein
MGTIQCSTMLGAVVVTEEDTVMMVEDRYRTDGIFATTWNQEFESSNFSAALASHESLRRSMIAHQMTSVFITHR